MKKIFLLSAFLFTVFSGFTQKQNGTVFIEHPLLEKVNTLWEAFEKGDKDAYAALLADKMVGIFNGNTDNRQTRENNINSVDWFNEEFENLEVVVDTPAYADAIVYGEGEQWVQDWLIIKGTHKKTGINLNLKEHHLYRFNDEGKITAIHYYFNNDVFQEIRNSQTTKENGKVYINHPYIVTVRKLVNAYCAEDLDAMLEFYDPKVRFSDATMKWRDFVDLEAEKKIWSDRFAKYDNFEMRQVGYPDCIYYAQNDGYVVYSWWIHKSRSVDTGKVVEFPIMLSHSFDKDGKIVQSMAYYSSNHIEE
ncbi:MAG: nuclear transport factor 2 family protein [Draconibacterium sp.]